MRNAASLLELVIAIVVMGIAMMTLPLMLTTTQSNNTFAMQQEAILAARTQLGDMLTYFWDENSIDSGNVIAVLDTNSSNNRFARSPDNSSIRRIGHVKGNKRRKFFSAITLATTPANLGKEAGETTPNDIDDFNGISTTLSDSTETLDYRFNFDMNTTVSYIDDNFTVGNTFDFKTSSILPSKSTNIKMTKLILLGKGSSSKNLNITLRSYTCNLGANQLLRRTF